MLEKILEFDTAVFVYLNSLGSETFDWLWLIITRQTSWIPVFAIILYLTFKRLGWRHALLLIVLISLLITLTDQTTNLFKNGFQRLRPGNNPDIAGFIRSVQQRSSFSFISGHASNSMAVSFFLYKTLKPYLKYMGFIFLWPLIFAYSRIYLGLHYPMDIIMGYMFGLLTASLFLFIYAFLRNKLFPQDKEALDDPANSKPISNR